VQFLKNNFVGTLQKTLGSKCGQKIHAINTFSTTVLTKNGFFPFVIVGAR